MEKYFVLCLLLYATAGCFADDLTYLNGFYSKTPQRLSKYSWFGNVRLHHFRVPEDAVLVRWLLTVSRGSGLNCGNQNITVHFRAGAPPVINPIQTAFPNSTSASLAHNLTLIVPSGQSSNVTLFNVTHPKPGDWFLAAHLPKDDGKIEQQGLPSCSYLFQAQMFSRRASDLPILQYNIPLSQTLTASPALFKVFVPEFSSSLDVFISNCSANVGNDCGLSITVGSSTLRQGSEVKQNCSGLKICHASVLIPPWNTWLLVTVETNQPNTSVPFYIAANVTVGCKPLSSSSDFNAAAFIRTIIAPQSNSSGVFGNSSTSAKNQSGLRSNSSEPMCMRSPSVFRDEQDVLSFRYIVSGNNLTVTSDLPTVLALEHSPGDSGGTLVVQLQLNTSSLIGGFARVKACLTPSAPVLQLNRSQTCATGFAQGYTLNVSSSESNALLRIPFPDAENWYLSLQTVCNDSVDCTNASATVSASVSVSACIDECGPYGECRLLRTYNYLYGACVCKAGWQGWGCTDGVSALSYSRQMTAALLLTLSNFFFIPPIIVALYRGYLIEAAIYLFTMFFSTFYHACDQPGVTVMCIMDYDTLQFCDFLGSVVSVWVTIVCMARLQEPIKYLLFMMGTLVISMAMQLDRRGLWNLLGPVLFALVIMVTSWVYRGVKRHQCYPPLWRRWVLFLLPGIVSALIGVCVYVFAQTDSNYYYTHSIWHVMVATSVVFLLPPREKHVPPWGWTNKICSYSRCKNEKVQLYTVT
ncbi:post-GPI attachment to proteins factor 6 isoform X1 [Danio rerio]|uniref:Post-GPI attachment to proteins factor 6 isoform X1 n=1 Tax=Danio rerio TaxID=7955 RepID=A0A8M2BI41_DANRE|nr:transmembrane protein 8A isoform X1 [Danio rerio]|eukprot:XP_005170920.1 transmembrane protein 8A isoform X1 [Danio rerio]